MSRFFTIVSREWRAYFLSPLGYVILASFLFMNGLIFAAILSFLSRPGSAKSDFLGLLFSNTFFWIFVLFVVASISMRLFPEERRSGTLEVLLTSPVSETEVVLAKFAGAWAFYVTLWIPSILYFAILGSRTTLDLAMVAGGYLATLLLGAYFISVGTFASTLTKNQIVAAIVAFAMLIPIFAAGLLDQMVNTPALKGAVGYLNLWDHMEEFSKGIIDSRRIVYYLSGTAFFLFLSIVSISARKETP